MTTVWIYVDTNKEVGDIDHQGIRDADLPISGSRRRSGSVASAMKVIEE